MKRIDRKRALEIILICLEFLERAIDEGGPPRELKARIAEMRELIARTKIAKPK